MTLTLTPLVSLLFSGATLTEHDDFPAGATRLGCPVWGSTQLLASLALRLGLPQAACTQAVRVQQWSRRMAELETSTPGRFYAQSHALDPVGTAETLLAWRDELVFAGWNGESIPNGGERLETLRDLVGGNALPPGNPDRLRCIESALRDSRTFLFDALHLTEPRTLWPGRWQRVFALLEEVGTSIRTAHVAFESATGDTDLARLQALLRGDAVSSARLRGDGSLVLLRAETSWELADATAALLRACNEPSTAIVRGGEVRPLDYALALHGLASQGLDATSACRPALQVLPLAVELAFEPRDPYRVLELLTLPVGPFQGLIGNELARALAEAPGIGGPAWREAKTRIAEVTSAKAIGEAETSGIAPAEGALLARERVLARLEKIATWLEQPGLDASKPAPRAALMAVASRVRGWLAGRLATARRSSQSEPANAELAARAEILATAFAQAQDFHETLSHEVRVELELVDLRVLLGQVASGHTLLLATEETGRIDPVDSPAALRRARDVIVWWHCVSGTERRLAVRPWRRAEQRALREAGVVLTDPAELLALEARSWQQAIQAARRRLILAIPRWALGQALEPHPVCDEIAAHLAASGSDISRVTIDARDLLAGRVEALGGARRPAVSDAGPLALPPARGEWHLDPGYLGGAVRHSATSLDALVGCPLQWVFKYPAELRPGALDSIASGPLLFGKLGHRLVEELHRTGGLAKPVALEDAISSTLDRLLREEAAVLLRPGMTFDLAQLREQFGRAVMSLSEILIESKLTVVGVEVGIEAPWRAGVLSGRLDLLLADEAGRDVVLDLKWGAKDYRERLESGRATQLAVYAAARQLATTASEMPAAAYFSLSRGQLLAMAGAPFASYAPVDGPPLADTWARLERTALRVEHMLLAGRALVTGVRSSIPLLDGMEVDSAERTLHLTTVNGASCRYCAYGALCGRQWQDLA